MSDSYEFIFWLKFKKPTTPWKAPAPATSKNEPDCKAGERAMKISVKIPQEVFDPPSMQAKINIAHTPIAPTPIDLEEVTTKLKSALGEGIEINIQQPNEEAG